MFFTLSETGSPALSRSMDASFCFLDGLLLLLLILLLLLLRLPLLRLLLLLLLLPAFPPRPPPLAPPLLCGDAAAGSALPCRAAASCVHAGVSGRSH